MPRETPDAHLVTPRPVAAGERDGGASGPQDPPGGAGPGGRPGGEGDWGGTRATAAPGAGLRRRSDVPDGAVLIGLLLVAAVLRFSFLAGRGMWDADQGHDMLVLLHFVERGEIPLLGPPTSIGDVHHGAAYYYLLAPLAFVSGSDPTVVVGGLAAAGTAAVGVVWWLARAIGGRLAGAIAGILVAVSPSAIEASTFLWNPNAITLTASIALAAAWQAHRTARPRWWLLAALATGLTMQLHVLGIGLLVPVAAFFAWSARSGGTARDPERRRSAIRTGIAGAAIVAALYVPLAIHEVTHDFAETRAAVAYLAAPGDGDDLDPVTRASVVLLRIVAWPLVGLVTDAPVPGLASLAGVLAIVAWRWRAPDPRERMAVRWFGLAIAWSTVFLAVAARGLTTVIPGLPNDHYHAFVDPMVFALVGLGLAAIARGRDAPVVSARADVTVGQRGPAGRGDVADVVVPAARVVPTGRGDTAGRVVAAVALGALVLVAVGRWPATTAADGGWPAARDAAARIGASTGGREIALIGLPRFKTTGAYGFPLVRDGRSVVVIEPPSAAVDAPRPDRVPAGAAVVVACDRLFEQVLQAMCGGPAEDAVLAVHADPARYRLDERFEASSRTAISVYLPAP